MTKEEQYKGEFLNNYKWMSLDDTLVEQRIQIEQLKQRIEDLEKL